MVLIDIDAHNHRADLRQYIEEDVHSSTLETQELHELNVNLAWVVSTARPLSLAELDAVLRRTVTNGNMILGLETRVREKYGSLFTLLRYDGLSTGILQARNHLSKQVGPYESIPEATTVIFADESIAKYFQQAEGKHAVRKSAPKIGVSRLEAHTMVLKTCIEVFVNSPTADVNDTVRTLRQYSMQHWYHHLQATSIPPRQISPVDQVYLINLMYHFLSDENIIRDWAQDITWTFYSEDAARTICAWVRSWSQSIIDQLDTDVQSWVTASTPETVFVHIARLCAKEGLQEDERAPLSAVQNVAQVKAFLDDRDTLDTLPEPVPLQTLLDAVEWTNLPETAIWHRKLAVCLRNAGYVNEAIPHFNTALAMDPSFTKARAGLAAVYRDCGFHSTVIELELELENANILERQIIKARHAPDPSITKELARSYDVVAYSYQQLDDTPSALRYWKKSAETLEIVQWGVFQYMRLLADSPEDDKWIDVVSLLRSMQSKTVDGMYP
jgi:tetratricopeptide (TPR) repeat protein